MDSKEEIAASTSRKLEKQIEKQPVKLSPVQEWDYYIGKVVESSICGKKGFKNVMHGRIKAVNVEFFTKAHVEHVMNNAAKSLRLFRKACDKTINKQVSSIESELKKLEEEISAQEKKGKIVNFFSSKLNALNHKQAVLLAEMRGLKVANVSIRQVSPSIFDEDINERKD